tara:strand:+ start:849 stop:1646 length:798 start_codon:yes stop_codon:yes gene_type:complete
MTRTNVKTVNAELLALPIIEDMRSLSPQQVNSMKGHLTKAISKRIENDPQGVKSKDFKHLESWKDSNALLRLFVAAKIDPQGYINQGWMDDAEVIKRGFNPVSRTKNLKAYKKVREIAEYIVSGQSRCEAVVKTFVACLIQASRFGDAINRETLYKFLSRIDLSEVSADLADAVSDLQAKHMTTGAQTQTSQLCLTLANLGVLTETRDGRTKRVTLNATSPITQAFAERFGMVEALEAVATRQAEALEAEVTEADVMEALEADAS